MLQQKFGQCLTKYESILIHYKQISYILNQINLWKKGVITIMHGMIIT